METLQKLMSVIMFLVFIFSVVLLVWTFRKPKKVSVPSLVISLITSFLSLLFYVIFLNYRVSLWVWVFMAGIGLVIGIFWARATRVYIQENRVMSRNSIWYLVVWGAVFALNQIITILTNRPPAIGMAMLIMSSAIVWGTNSSIIRRYLKVKADLGTAAPATVVQYVPQTMTQPATQIEQTVAEEPQIEVPAIQMRYCPYCGASVAIDAGVCCVCDKNL